jgi:hypothetical protein
MENRVDVVLEAGPARILERRQAAADALGALKTKGL